MPIYCSAAVEDETQEFIGFGTNYDARGPTEIITLVVRKKSYLYLVNNLDGWIELTGIYDYFSDTPQVFKGD